MAFGPFSVGGSGDLTSGESIVATSAELQAGAIVLTLNVEVKQGAIIRFSAPCDPAVTPRN